ncbi:MAG TPA: hypothetical protein VLA61_25080 [Ideonella sp.]|uniref:vanadium-dependent haloperoxidase n=1 Tax=Ideonella sp. TaxID=1929293 RepID=UPI002CA79291|nr:hypothetical protein [Ideonella sp.]HSI51556.1 hypothetical protein [Ideonella sp.]
MADPILFWNAVALEANRQDFTSEPGAKAAQEQPGPTMSSRALGLVHLAMYDAYFGALGFPAGVASPYLPGITPPAPPVDPDGAVAQAAYEILQWLYPAQSALFNRNLTQFLGANAEWGPARQWGHVVANQLRARRERDPGAGAGAGDSGYTYSQAPRHHRADPAQPEQRPHAPFYGARSACFAVQRRHALLAPPAHGTLLYSAELQRVRSKGIAPELAASVPLAIQRTPEETMIGQFWAYDGVRKLGTPPRLYNRILRQIAQAQGNSPTENAQLFALVNAAMADAGILAWEQKYVHDLWRPVVGIREHDTAEMGPSAVGSAVLAPDCDPGWLPLGAPASNSFNPSTKAGEPNGTPPFPAYPSGHATFGAAALHMIELFYDGKLGQGKGNDVFQNEALVSEELDGQTTSNTGVTRPRHARTFPGGLRQMIEENGWSRVYLGVHWLFDAFLPDADVKPDLSQPVGGVPLGLAIAEHIFQANKGTSAWSSPVGPAQP